LIGTPNLAFRQFDSVGTPVSPALTRNACSVIAGLQPVGLDFGAVFSGLQRRLQVSVNGTALLPRIAISRAPIS
jgi:hypothetical protein